MPPRHGPRPSRRQSRTPLAHLAADGYIRRVSARTRGPRLALSALIVTVLALSQLGTALSAASEPPSKQEVKRAAQGLERSQRTLETLENRLRRASTRLDSIRTRMDALDGEVQSIARRLLLEEKAMVRIARKLYKDGGTAGILKAALSAKSMAEFDTRVSYLKTSSQAHLERLQALIADKQLLDRRLDDLDTARSEASAVLDEVEELRAGVLEEVAKRRSRLRSLESERRRWEAARAAAARAAAQAQALASPPDPDIGSFSVNWDAIAQCESGGNWHIDSTYDGGLQFHPETWLAYGGGRYARYAWQASRLQQIGRAHV